MDIKTKIRELRLSKGLTQSELAAAIGVHKNAIVNYELGLRTPALEIALLLAVFFDITLDELVGRK